MRAKDPYDPRVAFDDVYGGEEVVEALAFAGPSPMMLLGALMLVVARIRGRTLRAPEFDVSPAPDATARSFQSGAERLSMPIGLPLYDGIRRRFELATPAPRLVRVDDVASYRDFRTARCTPYIRQLARRIEALEEALAHHRDSDEDYFDDLEDRFQRHISDGHGGDIDALGAEVFEAAEAAQRGGARVSLSAPAWAAARIDCWQDGPEVLCTLRLADGRFITSGAPVAEHVTEVLDCCAGVAPDEARVIAPTLSLRIAGESLLRQLASVAPVVSAAAGGARSFVGLMTPRSDAPKAAIMALLQHCQRGDARALNEVRSLENAGAPVVDALACLTRAQTMKARSIT